MSMFNECHIHSCDCTCLNVFSHAQSMLINHKKTFKCFSCFWKVFWFCKNVKNFKNSVKQAYPSTEASYVEIKQACYDIQKSKEWHSNQTHSCYLIKTNLYSNQCMFIWMHDLPHCITAPMHQCMFIFCACAWHLNNLKILITIKEIKQTN